MVDTVGPMVHASKEGEWRVETAHLTGGVVGGAATGFFFGAIGSFVDPGPELSRWFSWTLAALAGVALVYDSIHEGKKLGLSRQTPRAWRHVLSPPAAAFFNGADLGLGWSTRIYFTSYLVAMTAAAGTGHALVGAVIGASFGLARSGFVVVAQRRPERALSIDSIAAHRPKIAVLNGVALTQFGLLMVVTAVAGP